MTTILYTGCPRYSDKGRMFRLSLDHPAPALQFTVSSPGAARAESRYPDRKKESSRHSTVQNTPSPRSRSSVFRNSSPSMGQSYNTSSPAVTRPPPGPPCRPCRTAPVAMPSPGSVRCIEHPVSPAPGFPGSPAPRCPAEPYCLVPPVFRQCPEKLSHSRLLSEFHPEPDEILRRNTTAFASFVSPVIRSIQFPSSLIQAVSS